MHVLYFAACRERAGLDREELDLGGRTVAEAVSLLGERHRTLVPLLPRCRVALNSAFAESSAVVPDGSELVLIPPVAGG